MSVRDGRCFWSFLLPGVLSCGDIFGSAGDSIFLATIDSGDEEFGIRIQTPSEVKRGESFEIAITSYPHRFCQERGPDRIEIKGLRAVVRPFDRQVSPNCPDVLQVVVHTPELRFETEGSATIVVEGERRFNPGDGLVIDTIAVERFVHVR